MKVHTIKKPLTNPFAKVYSRKKTLNKPFAKVNSPNFANFPARESLFLSKVSYWRSIPPPVNDQFLLERMYTLRTGFQISF